MSGNVFANLPSIQQLMDLAPLKSVADRVNRTVVASRARRFLDELRQELQSRAAVVAPGISELAERLARKILEEERTSLRPVINATGVVLHDALGEPPLADEAVAEVATVARDYSALELNLDNGEPALRCAAVEQELCNLTGAEDALVVHSSGSAMLLCLSALASQRKLIVARSQLFERSGATRLADLITASGSMLTEVGAANRVRIEDYAQAIGNETAAILAVHAHDVHSVGATERPSIEALVALARERSLPLIEDIDIGPPVALDMLEAASLPNLSHSATLGVDVAIGRGDKLLGGPQCGIIVGRRATLSVIRRHPLLSALAPSKLTVAALAGTLRLYRRRETSSQTLPVLQLLATSIDNLRLRAERLAPQIAATAAVATAEAIASTAALAHHKTPANSMPSYAVAVTPQHGSAEQLARQLSGGVPAVIGVVDGDRVVLDLKAVFPRQDIAIVAAFESLAGESPSSGNVAADSESPATE